MREESLSERGLNKEGSQLERKVYKRGELIREEGL